MMSSRVALGGALLASILFVFPNEAAAQSNPDLSSEDRHRLELEKRDAIIADLIERVTRLEKALDQQSKPVALAPDASSDSLASAPAELAAPPPRGSRNEASEEEIDRALEQSLVQSGALLLRGGAIQFVPTFSYSRHHRDIPVLISNNGTLSLGELRVRQNGYVSNLAVRLGLPYNSQFEVGIPYTVVRQSNVTLVGGEPRDEVSTSNSSLGDLRLSLSHALLSGSDVLPDIVGRITWDTGSGKRRVNGNLIDGGFSGLTGSLSLIKREDPLVFVGSAFYDTRFTDRGRVPGDSVGFSLGAHLAASPETSLRFVFNQQFTGETEMQGARIAGSGRNISLLTIGTSSVLGRGVFLDVSAALGLTEDSPDYIFAVSIPVRIR